MQNSECCRSPPPPCSMSIDGHRLGEERDARTVRGVSIVQEGRRCRRYGTEGRTAETHRENAPVAYSALIASCHRVR